MSIDTVSSNTTEDEIQNGHMQIASPLTRLAVGLSISLSLLVLLGIATEVISIAALPLFQGNQAARLHHSYYQGRLWSAEYWREFESSKQQQYRPYVIWRRAPFRGKYINVDEDGLRRTVNPDCSSGARQIWMFGGSTLWGMGAPDDQTIPSILSEEYARSIGPVCVTNFGEGAWVSTQNVIELELALKRASRPPDLVLFYDGYTDILAAYQSGRADVHVDLGKIRYLVEEGNKRSSFAFLKHTATYRLVSIVMNQVASLKTNSAPTSRPSRDLDSLAKMSVENYRANMKVVESLSAQYGFHYTAFWSPFILVGNKPLSHSERNIVDSILRETPELPNLCQKTYDRMFSVPDPHIVDISDTIDQTKSDTYLDVGHMTPDGYRLVALRILETIKKSDRELVLRR